MRIEQCQTCYFSNENSLQCNRYPAAALVAPTWWCGEWRAQNEKLCWANGAEINPAREATPGLEANGIKFPGLPARPASYRHCYREKGHEGPHSLGWIDWE